MSKKSTREDLCHVLLDGTVAERVLAFSKGKDGVKPGLVVPVPAGGKVPAKVGARDWQLLIKPRLDVAWMSATEILN